MAGKDYRLTSAAASDLEQLYEWGIGRFGIEVADCYYDRLIERFDQIAKNPLQWPAVDYIRSGYRRSICGSHSIFYRIEEQLVIVRILGKQNPGKSLPDS